MLEHYYDRLAAVAAPGTRAFANILDPSAVVFYNLARQVSAADGEIALEIQGDPNLTPDERMRFRNLTACAAGGGAIYDYCSSNGHTVTIGGLASGSLSSTKDAATIFASWVATDFVGSILGDTLKASVGLLRAGRAAQAGGEVVAGSGGSLSLTPEESWANVETLLDHFTRHGADFSSPSATAYANEASEFFQYGIMEGLPTKITSDGTIRIYDPGTNTFGSYAPGGGTKTFFKPSRGEAYWIDQPGTPQ